MTVPGRGGVVRHPNLAEVHQLHLHHEAALVLRTSTDRAEKREEEVLRGDTGPLVVVDRMAYVPLLGREKLVQRDVDAAVAANSSKPASRRVAVGRTILLFQRRLPW